MQTNLYDVLKGRIYGITQIACGRDNRSANAEGHKDVYALLMSDSDHGRMPVFIGMLMTEIPSEGQRRVLLDGLAREYAGVDNWLAFVDREAPADPRMP